MNDQSSIYPEAPNALAAEHEVAANALSLTTVLHSGITVFWLENGLAQSQGFPSKELLIALKFTESLRCRRTAGEAISHVCLSTEHEESVGQAGVSDKLPEGYDWSKQDRAGKSRRR